MIRFVGARRRGARVAARPGGVPRAGVLPGVLLEAVAHLAVNLELNLAVGRIPAERARRRAVVGRGGRAVGLRLGEGAQQRQRREAARGAAARAQVGEGERAVGEAGAGGEARDEVARAEVEDGRLRGWGRGRGREWELGLG